MRTLPQRLLDQQSRLRDVPGQRLEAQQTHIVQAISQEIAQLQERQQQQFEALIENSLAAQLLAIEQLISQRISSISADLSASYALEPQADFTDFEVQTEIPWEDLTDAIDKSLQERLSTLGESIQTAVKNMEHLLSAQLQSVREDLLRRQQIPSYDGNITNIQEVFASIEQLQRIIESMQVAMTANHALLSNRLYHHQQLPLERAHPSNHTANPHEKTTMNNQLPLPRNRESE
jgi:hypothetical protein